MRISQEELARFEASGMVLNGAIEFAETGWANDINMAMDALPTLATTPNAGVPAWLESIIDSQMTRVVFAPNKGAKIFGEVKKGDWLMKTALFPVIEHTGEVSSYGDYSNNGRTSVNTDFPNRQSYLYQIIKEYGEYELEVAGLAKISWVTELDMAAQTVLNKFQNLTYFFGVNGLENYGLTNDPSLNASLTPAPKQQGGVTWFTTGNAPNASANEVYNDILAVFEQLVAQGDGQVDIDMENELVLGLPPSLMTALGFTNAFGITAREMLEKNFPNLKVESAVQYGALTASNTQGVAAGNYVQLICKNAGGQDTGYCAFNEKLRTHPIIRDLSSFKQKATQGSWGAIIRQPWALASMIGC